LEDGKLRDLIFNSDNLDGSSKVTGRDDNHNYILKYLPWHYKNKWLTIIEFNKFDCSKRTYTKTWNGLDVYDNRKEKINMLKDRIDDVVNLEEGGD